MVILRSILGIAVIVSRMLAPESAHAGGCDPTTTSTSTSTSSSTSTSTSSSTSTSTSTSTTTSTSTSTTTTTSTMLPVCPVPLISKGSVAFTVTPASPNCGAVGALGTEPPFSGEVLRGNGTHLRDLGTGCLYIGGGGGLSVLPGSRIPDGSTALLDVQTVNGLSLQLAASNGTGPDTCTRGAGPDRECVDGSPGTNGLGACTDDTDCLFGPCILKANCYFGPPVPVATPVGAFSTCVLNAIATDACGTADLDTGDSSLSVALAARVYLTGDQASPCPRCVSGTCTAGARAGLACSGGVGSGGTSLDCPPGGSTFVGVLPVTLGPLTTGESVLSVGTGFFCPDQPAPGAFNLGIARTIRQTGSPLLGGPTIFSTTLAGNFCVPSSGSDSLDNNAALPGPGSVSVAGEVSMCALPGQCATLCTPCLLGPLCDLLCNPCVLCGP